MEVKVAPGGAESIIKYNGPAALNSGDDIYVLLDGDKKKVDEFTDPVQIAPAQYPGLSTLLKDELGCEPKFLLAGGNDPQGHEAAMIKARLDYLAWLRKRVVYLPKICPEKILLDAIDPHAARVVMTAAEAKDKLREILADGVDVTGSEMLALEKVKVARISDENVDLVQIRSQLRVWLHQT